MTVEEYMQINRGVKKRLKALYEQMEAVQTAVVYPGKPITETSDIHAKNKAHDNNAEYVVLMEDIENEIRKQQGIHIEMIRNILLLDIELQSAATMYYIDGLSLAEVARELDISSRSAYRRRQLAIEAWEVQERVENDEL